MQHDDPHNEDWEKEAPLLASLRGEQPHGVPGGYFEALPDQVMARIRTAEPAANDPAAVSDTAPLPAPDRSRFWSWQRIGLAASLALLIGTGAFFWGREAVQPGGDAPEMASLEAQWEGLTDDELLDALAYEDVNDEEVAMLMGDEALAAMEAEAYGEQIMAEDVDLNVLDLEDIDLHFEDLDDFLNEN